MVGIVIATHCDIARALVQAAELILGQAEGAVAVTLQADQDREQSWAALVRACDSVDQGDGLLVLADMFGGTPSNLAMALLADRRVEVVTGVNLPMALRAIQKRPDTDLPGLVQEVLAYGRRNVTSASEWLNSPAASTEDAP